MTLGEAQLPTQGDRAEGSDGVQIVLDLHILRVEPKTKRNPKDQTLIEATPGYLDATLVVGVVEFPPGGPARPSLLTPSVQPTPVSPSVDM